MKNTLKTLSFIALILLSFSLNAQTGSIRGIVKDSASQEGIPGVSITLFKTSKMTVAGGNGEFNLDQVKEGTYTITFNRTGFYKTTLDSIVVKANKTTDLGIVRMAPKYDVKAGAKITFKKAGNTVKDAITDQKKSEQVINVITQESIKNSQDGDAAKVGSRIPGVTLMENRFIMLRGLSQRYNSVQINNIGAPSTEIDKRSFSFDLIPSSMLDKMSVYKSPASDLPGDFAGGVIKLQTKSEIEKDFYTYNIGLGFRFNTSLTEQQNNGVGSATDYLGFDNGNRALPSGFPQSLSGYSAAQNVYYGKQLRNNFELNKIRVPLDFGMGFGFGKNIKLGKMKLFTVNNFGYASNFQFASMSRYRYQFDAREYVTEMFNYKDDNLSVESRFNVLSNWILKVNNKTTFTFRNIFNQTGENETTVRNGTTKTDRPEDEWRNYSFHYTSRSIYFTQFEGQHRISKTDRLTYTLGYSRVQRNEPDFRRFRTVRKASEGGSFTLVDPPSANLFDAARFWSDLKENTVALNLNYETKFRNRLDSSKPITFRAGTYAESKNRNFTARWLSYKYAGDPTLKGDFLQTPFNQIFSADNIRLNGGFKPEEGTNPSDQYKADNNTFSTYINASIPVKQFNFNVGVRSEYFRQTLNSATQNGPVNVVLDSFNLLPSVNVAYNYNPKTILRLAYGKTVNRPEFRELAPFVYYDFMYDVNIVGNPNLKQATIDNMDFRIEHYPSSDETYSFGLFYKNFANPIENYVQPVGLSQQFYLKNAKSATNMGAEIEVRKSFDKNTQNAFFKNLSLVLNASYIISKVNLGDDSTLSQDRSRPLQGQSPFIINTVAQYKTDSGLTVSLAYNIFGKRIAYVGNNIFPTVYEMPRHSVDLTVVRDISKRISVKFGVSDVLNFKHRLWQDTNNDGKINYKIAKTDNPLLEYRRGQMFSIGFSWKLSEK